MNKLLLERVTYWHALLTPFTQADKSGVMMLDILASNGVLYQGESFQYFLESEGKLAGIILKNPRRFMRDEYLAEKKERGAEVDKESFWRTIPSESLFISGSTILNLNINYKPGEKPLEEVLRKYIEQTLKAEKIKISIGGPVSPSSVQETEGVLGSTHGQASEPPT